MRDRSTKTQEQRKLVLLGKPEKHSAVQHAKLEILIQHRVWQGNLPCSAKL